MAAAGSKLEARRAAVVAGSITGNQVSVTLFFWFKETCLPCGNRGQMI